MNADVLWQLARYGLLAIGGYFTNKGVVDGDTVTTVVSSIGTLFTALWGVYVKYGTKAVPVAVADKPSIPTVSSVTGQINSGPGIQK